MSAVEYCQLRYCRGWWPSIGFFFGNTSFARYTYIMHACASTMDFIFMELIIATPKHGWWARHIHSSKKLQNAPRRKHMPCLHRFLVFPNICPSLDYYRPEVRHCFGFLHHFSSYTTFPLHSLWCYTRMGNMGSWLGRWVCSTVYEAALQPWSPPSINLHQLILTPLVHSLRMALTSRDSNA